MTKLIIRLAGQVSSEVILDPSKPWIAGRKVDADIVLEAEKGISREHFKIFEENGTWKIEVLSRLGNMTLNGQNMTSAVLTSGTIFSLPPYEFEFSITANEIEVSQISSSFDDRTVVHKVNLSAYIKIINEEGDVQQKIKLEGGDTWTAGRDVNAQILIADHRVSRRQFEIRKTTLGYEIVDLGSVNGTFVNEKVLESEDTVVLKSGDVIRVLNHNLTFEILDPHFFDKIEKFPASTEPVQIEFSQSPAQLEPLQPAVDLHATENYEPLQDDSKAQRTKKMRIGLVAAIAIGAIFYMFSSPSDDKAISNVVPAGGDPLSALTSQQKSEYRQSLELAKRYHMEGNYNLSYSETEELAKKFNVKDPELERVKNTALAAIESQKLLMKQEKETKEREQMEARILAVTAQCEKNLNTFENDEELDNCLVEALQLNPVHSSIADLKSKMQAIMLDKNARKAQKAEYNRKVALLKGLYEDAKKNETENDYIKIIAAYKKVISSSHPDPEGLKKASDKRLAKLKIEMGKKLSDYQKQAIEHRKKQELKQAILTLRSAVKIDPTREDLKETAEEIKNELRKQMMVYYQEGVLEESFGNVEGGDNRPGAKDKWKKILELDVTDGEYYQKAYIKLKKYGAT